ALAGIEATRLGVSIFNIHASGGREMMKRTAGAVAEVAARENLTRPRVLAVTLLTSVDEETLRQIGIEGPSTNFVSRLACLADECGLDGVVASAWEIGVIRAAIARSDFLIVTPGMRGITDQKDDQGRVMTVSDAIKAGADYVVVGRPVLNAEDPKAAASEIVKQIADALDPQHHHSRFAEPSRAQSVH